MIWTRAFAISLLATVSSVVSAAYNVDLVSTYPENVLPITIPGRYIIEYSSDYDAETSAEEIASHLGTTVSVSQNLDSEFYNGASIQVEAHSNKTTDEILSLDFVSSVYPVEVVSIGDWGTYVSNETSNWNPHSVTGVDKLHDEGITGEGIIVAIVDSGVNYNLEALGGGYGAGYKIVGGYDYVGDNYDYSDPDSMVPDDNPMDCLGHGSFVSSVILGESKDITGVAPRTHIKMYRVFGCSDGTTTDLIMKALSDAASAKPDVINLSLGSASGYSMSPIAKLSDSISEQNIPVVWAAGNAGTTGTFYASNGASSTKSISVGSVDSTQGIRFPLTITASNGSTLDTYYYTKKHIQSSFTGTLPADFSSSNGCFTSPSGISSRALIIRRGICNVNIEYNGLADTGYEYIFRYNSYDQEIDDWYDVDATITLYALIPEEAGLWVKAIEKAGFNVSVTLDASDAADAYESDLVGSGQVSYYSSMGPTFENDFYPTISAPGGKVLGVYYDVWEVASGTSFAAPYIAGVVALYKQVYGDVTTTEIKQRMVATAKLLDLYSSYASAVDTDNLHPLIQQGAGLVNAYKMIHQNTTLLSKYHLELNDTVHRVSDFELEIYNGNSYQVTYNISHVAAATIQGRSSTWYPSTYFPSYDSSKAGVTFSDDTLILGPGESGSITVSFTSPSTSLEGPIFNGRIEFGGDNGEVVGVPYMGVDVDTGAWTALEDDPLFLYYNSTDSTYYGFAASPGEVDITEFVLRVYYSLRYGTEIFSIDLVAADYDLEADFSYPETSDKFFGSVMSSSATSGDTAFPINYPTRFSGTGFSYISSFNDSSSIPSGEYKVLVRSLKPFSDRYSVDGWQRFLSSSINIVNPESDEQNSSVSSSMLSSISSDISSSSSQLSTSSDSSTLGTFSAISSFVSSSFASSIDGSSPTSILSTSTASETTAASSVSAATGTPSGLDDITEIKLYDYAHYYQSTLTNVVDSVDDWVVVYVKFYQPTKTYANSVIQFSIPDDFTDVASGGGLAAPGLEAAGVSYNSTTRLVTIKFDEYIRWHSEVTGSFALTMKLSSSGKAKVTAPGTYTYEFVTVSGVLTSDLVFQGVSDSAPTILGYMNEDAGPTWEIYVPAELGKWDSVTVSGAYVSSRWSISCSDSSLVIATEFDIFNEATATVDPDSTEVVKTCSLETLIYEYDGFFTDSTLSKRDTVSKALVYTVVGIQSVSWATTFEGAFTVSVVNENGTTTYSLNKQVRSGSYMIADDYAVSGVRDTPEYTGEPASSSTVVTPLSSYSSSAASSSLSSIDLSSSSTFFSEESFSLPSATDSYSSAASFSEDYSYISSAIESISASSGLPSLSAPSSTDEYTSLGSSSIRSASASDSASASASLSVAEPSILSSSESSAPSGAKSSDELSSSSSFSSVVSSGFYYGNSSTVSSVVSSEVLPSAKSSAFSVSSVSSSTDTAEPVSASFSVTSSEFGSHSSSVAALSDYSSVTTSTGASSVAPSIVASSETSSVIPSSVVLSESFSATTSAIVSTGASASPASSSAILGTSSVIGSSAASNADSSTSSGASSTVVSSAISDYFSAISSGSFSSNMLSESASASSDGSASASTSSSIPASSSSGPGLSFEGFHNQGKIGYRLRVPGTFGPFKALNGKHDLKFSPDDFYVDLNKQTCPSSYFSADITGDNLDFRFSQRVKDSDEIEAGFFSSETTVPGKYAAVLYVAAGQGSLFKRAEETYTLTATLTVTASSSSSIQTETAVFSTSVSDQYSDIISSATDVQSDGVPSSSASVGVQSSDSPSSVGSIQSSGDLSSSSVSFSVTSSAFQTSVVTASQESTVVYTVTSCSENKCSEIATSGVVSVITSTAAGSVVTYTTTVPCNTAASTITYVVTSCSASKCSDLTTSGVLSKSTSTAVNGQVVTLTSTVPCEATSSNTGSHVTAGSVISVTSTNKYLSGVSTATYINLSPINSVLTQTTSVAGPASAVGSVPGSSNYDTGTTNNDLSTTTYSSVSGSGSISSETSAKVSIKVSSTSTSTVALGDSTTAAVSTYEGSASGMALSTCGCLLALVAGAIFI